MTTKTHYIHVANIFARHRPTIDPEQLKLWENMREDFCDVFADENPSFDCHRFIVATEQKVIRT